RRRAVGPRTPVDLALAPTPIQDVEISRPVLWPSHHAGKRQRAFPPASALPSERRVSVAVGDRDDDGATVCTDRHKMSARPRPTDVLLWSRADSKTDCRNGQAG